MAGDVDPAAFLVGLANIQEHVGEAIVAMVVGYRTQILEAGFSEGAAELLTIDYQRAVLAAIFHPSESVTPS